MSEVYPIAEAEALEKQAREVTGGRRPGQMTTLESERVFDLMELAAVIRLRVAGKEVPLGMLMDLGGGGP